MEAVAVVCRGGLLARARPGDRARLHGLGSGPAASAARRRFLVASLGGPLSAPSPNAVAVGLGSGPAASAARRRFLVASLGAPLSAPSPNAVAVAQETVQVDEDVASAEILPTPDFPVKTVHVKFVLQKQCAFGQQFLVVGDDSALGFWDPTKASALDWSEDHVWTVKKDLPANKLIEFKFLLQDPSGQVRWQHGPNRTLQITETSNTLVVYEDWDHAKNQKISEEVELSIGAEDVIFSGSNGALLADELQTDEYQETNKGVTTVSVDGEKSAAVADASLHREKMGANGANQPQVTTFAVTPQTTLRSNLSNSNKRKKVSPMGLAFACCAAVASTTSTTSLAVRSVALWVVGKPVGFCLSHLMALLLLLSLSCLIITLMFVVGRSASLL